jgi:ureidoglycolate hydrolase
MHLPVEILTPEAFMPFGKVIRQPDLPPDASGPGWTWWGETALMAGDERPYAIGYLDLKPSPLEFDWAERHMHSVEVLIPVRGDCLVYVGPPEHPEQPDRLPALDRFRVFRVPQGQGVLLERGVWHGAPLAMDRPVNVVVFLLKDSGTLDGSLVRFSKTPLRIQEG